MLFSIVNFIIMMILTWCENFNVRFQNLVLQKFLSFVEVVFLHSRINLICYVI